MISGRTLVNDSIKCSKPALRPTQPLLKWILVALSPEVKRSGREADHSSETSVLPNNDLPCRKGKRKCDSNTTYINNSHYNIHCIEAGLFLPENKVLWKICYLDLRRIKEVGNLGHI
jgi:hypothetical protein